MAGLNLDPEFKERLKGAGQQLKKIKDKAVSGLEAIHAQGKPTGPARQRMLSPKKKDISKPTAVGAGSSPSVLATKKARQNIAPVNKNIADPLALESTPEKRVPTPSFDARDTIPRSTIFNKARENIQRQGEGEGASFPDTFGSMYIKDPTTGQNIPREGYYNEAGTFIPGARTKMKDIGSLVNYNIRGVDNPELQKVITEGITSRAGILDPETGRVGSELARSGEQTLANIRGKYAERVANIQGQYGVEEAGILSEGRRTATAPLKPYTGTLSQKDEFGNITGQVPYSEYTGQVAPGFEPPPTELSPEVQEHIDKIRSMPKKMKQFYLDNPGMRESIKKYLESIPVYR